MCGKGGGDPGGGGGVPHAVLTAAHGRSGRRGRAGQGGAGAGEEGGAGRRRGVSRSRQAGRSGKWGQAGPQTTEGAGGMRRQRQACGPWPGGRGRGGQGRPTRLGSARHWHTHGPSPVQRSSATSIGDTAPEWPSEESNQGSFETDSVLCSWPYVLSSLRTRGFISASSRESTEDHLARTYHNCSHDTA